MKYQELLNQSKKQLNRPQVIDNQIFNLFIFRNGAHWMLQQMNELDGKKRIFDATTPYEKYGYLKYGFCLTGFFLSSFFLFFKAIFLLPFAIVVFYILEIHFLFLFPLLIDNVDNPISKSVKMTYKIGFFSALVTVLPIGIFMMIGLLNLRYPLKNWHLGCLSILIWYDNERD